MRNSMFLTAVLIIVLSCKNNSDREQITYKRYDKITNIKDQIVDIKTDLIFGDAGLSIADNFLVIDEYTPNGAKGIHLFDKNSFEFVTSTAIIGKGPGEVNRQGGVVYNATTRDLWVSDHGKMVLWKFPLDSILSNNHFLPTESIPLNYELFISRYSFLNDSIAIGKAITINRDKSFEVKTAKLNVNTNEIVQFGYEHPYATGKKSNGYFALSKKHNIYVCPNIYCDLMTVCDLNGSLKFNILGPDWKKNKDNRKEYFSPTGVVVAKNYIIAAYLNEAGIIMDKQQRPRGNSPSKLMVFDINGNYIQTIETGHKFIRFCVDEENNRIIAYFNDRLNPLGYFKLNL